jgi:hypothetical protein
MLLLLATTAQVLLLSELLLRRILYLVFPACRTSVQRFADTSVLSLLAGSHRAPAGRRKFTVRRCARVGPKNRPYLSTPKNLGNIFCEHPVISWY